MLFKKSSQCIKRKLGMLTSFWKIVCREMIASVSSPVLCSRNHKGMGKRDVDLIVGDVFSRMNKWKSQFVHMWMRSRRIVPTNLCFIKKKKVNVFVKKKKVKEISLKLQFFISKQDCFSEACICYKQTRQIHTEIESFKERVWFTCLA